MKRSLLVSLLLLTNALPLLGVQCPVRTEQEMDLEHATQDIQEFCTQRVYDIWFNASRPAEECLKFFSANGCDKAIMNKFCPHDHQVIQKCFIAHQQAASAVRQLAKHPKNCQYDPHLTQERKNFFLLLWSTNDYPSNWGTLHIRG